MAVETNSIPDKSTLEAQEEANWRSYDLLITDDLNSGRDVGIFARSEVLKGQGRKVWSLTRTRSDEEIICTLLDSLRTPRWTIHTPLQGRGWYLILRSPSLVDIEDYISIRPESTSSSTPPSTSEGGLKFSLRCKVADGDQSKLKMRKEDGGATTSLNLGDPNPNIPPLSPSLQEAETDPLTPTVASMNTSPVITRGGSTPATRKRTFKIHSVEIARGWGWTLVKKTLGTEDGLHFVVFEDDVTKPLIRFDEVSIPWSLSLSPTTRGVLKLHEARVNSSGMAPSFWVAVALAYLGFIEEKEAYKAASAD